MTIDEVQLRPVQPPGTCLTACCMHITSSVPGTLLNRSTLIKVLGRLGFQENDITNQFFFYGFTGGTSESKV